MKRFVTVIILCFLLSFSTNAYDVTEEIEKEINADELQDIVPKAFIEDEALSGLEFSYLGASDALTPTTLSEKVLNLFLRGFKAEIAFLFLCFSFLIISSVYKSFSSSFRNTDIKETVSFAISLFLFTLLFSHVMDALSVVTSYVKMLSNFMRSLLPIMATLLCMQGGAAEAVSTSVVVIFAITLVQGICAKVVIPMVKLLFSFVCAGSFSRINFIGITETITSIASKTCTISMSILSSVLYFKNAMSSATDSFALRSVKLAATNFIPVVGGMVSESASSLISAVRAVKSTLGVFGFAVLLYMTLIPLVSFLIKKLSLRILSAIAGILGCDEASSVFKSVYGIYHILSALMLSSGIFFSISIGLFVKSGAV